MGDLMTLWLFSRQRYRWKVSQLCELDESPPSDAVKISKFLQ